MLKTRIKTGMILTLIFTVFLYFSNIPYVLNVLSALLSILAIWELYSSVPFNNKSFIYMFVSHIVTVILSFIPLTQYTVILYFLFPVTILGFIVLIHQVGHYKLDAPYKRLPIALMFPLFFRALPEIRREECGLMMLITAIGICVLTDVSAYFIGRALGKKKIAPKISPNKTIAGCVGGIVVSVTVITMAVILADIYMDIRVNYLILLIYLVTASVVGQFGDFAMSSIKRTVGVKDFGKILPGHGGILDRFDSLLFVAPFTIYYYAALNRFI